ncbi:hypothetical protein EYR41_012016 [Orbilia oligospora]|uniref:Uncharacterized protein n=1 Tax=Orbilia oligospora TaxID=2813651 RepID=A0A7C8PVB8_ORBOL|nr:hypothetical protein TWF751_010262 [Orbilia oligospora]TGJ62835.1 hypothetical protein EYR41_012016 [Orbilia oligospora]
MFRICANPLIRCRPQANLISQFFNFAEQNTAGSPILKYRASRSSRNQGKYMGFATISAVPIASDSIDKRPYITDGGLLRAEKHIVPAFPIRELVRGVRTGNEKLELVANCYRPLSNLNPKPGDLTILAAHGNGFHKELYEPFFESLVEEYQRKGSQIRSIWIADFHSQGESGVLNERKLGGDVSWYDHSWDLLSLVMHLQNDFPRPIAAIGHSMGGAQLFNLSLMHPTLFSCVIGLDPIISPLPALPGASPGNPATLSAKRRDIWPSHEEAVKYFKSRPFYREWDPKVLEIHMKYGLRKVPTALYPDVTKVGPDAVTLRTTKHQEVFTFWRTRIQDRTEPKEVFSRLKDMKAPVCYIQGEDSIVNWGNKNELMILNTPQPCEIHFIPKCGHLVPLQKPKETAMIAATYLQRRTTIWSEETEREKENWPATTKISPHYFEHRLRERTQADNHSSYDAGVGHQAPVESHV